MKRTALPPRRTPIKRGKPIARSRIKRKPAPHGFPERTRMAVRRRSGGRCEAGASPCVGTASHFHHRKLRRSKDHSESNCLHVCSACHEFMHRNPLLARVMGWIVSQEHDPTEIAVKRGDGLR
jgi:hypothetical protein